MKEILLVGGAGYIGTVLTEYLLNKNFKVKCLDSLIYSQKDSIKKFLKNPNYTFILEDMRNNKSIEDYINKNTIKNIVILAGLVGDPITKKYPLESENINYLAIKNFLDKCNGKKIDKIIFISTCSNYGIVESNTLADENTILKPASNYAKHKVEIEKYILSLKNKIDYSPTILRFATAFGLSPRMRFDLTINQFTKEILEGKNLKIYDPDTWRPYCHVIDFARLITSVILTKKDKTNFEIFNAGSDENNFTKRQILDQIINIIPFKNFTFVKGDPDPRDYRVNFSKIKKILNFEARYSVQDGINEICSAIKSKKLEFQNSNLGELGNFKISENISK
tara:strand:+ start:116 stop:1126 length:1011 start_codon:yes stop_codon:yes gene_type:complete